MARIAVVPRLPEALERYVPDNERQFRAVVERTIAEMAGNVQTSLEELETGYGGIWVNDGTTPQTSIGATPVKITGFVSAMETSDDVTASAANDNITVAVSGIYLVFAQIAFSGSVNKEFDIHLNVNAVEADFGTHRVLGSTGDVGSCSISGLCSLDSDLRVEVIGGGSNSMTLADGQFYVKRIKRTR
jgi:hypothetical protein